MTWRVHTSAAGLVPLEHITGRVDPRAFDFFAYLCDRFEAEVEPIRKDWSWGWANRAVRGATTTSLHASARAIDLNAPKHPLGTRGTFTPAQRSAIRAIQTDLGGPGVVRWGGDYRRRADEMHFELLASPEVVQARVRDAKARETALKVPAFRVDVSGLPAHGRNPRRADVSLTKVAGQAWQQQYGRTVRVWDVVLIQAALQKWSGQRLPHSGHWDSTTKWCYWSWQKWALKYAEGSQNGQPGKHSLTALGNATGVFEVVR